MDESSIFLTVEEAINAIVIDFRHYHPQVMLFCSVIGLISEDDVRFKREPGKKGVWISLRGRPNMRWMEGAELIEYMCAAIRNTRWTIELLAAVCSRVFHCQAAPAADPETGRAGLRIATHMASFACRQCGCCCRTLDYHHEATAEDVARWKALGRDDILRWVDTRPLENGTVGYRIWVVPGTQELAGTCPFLKKEPTANRWGCEIHAIKPRICRNYPVSRKHAVMTGCQGFGTTGRN